MYDDIFKILNNKKINDSEKVRLIKDLFKFKKKIPVEIENIIKNICLFFEISIDAFLYKSYRTSNQNLILAKKIYAYLTKDFMYHKIYSSTKLASFINKDHSTYLYYIKEIKKSMSLKESKFNKLIELYEAYEKRLEVL